MTIRQQILKLLYPMFVRYRQAQAGKSVLFNEEKTKSRFDFFSLHAEMIDGTFLQFSQLRGRKVLFVNTASDCGYTAQYEELQQLHERFSHLVTIIAFPANDFKQQEKGSDEAVAHFCRSNFGVSFLLAKKSVVRKSEGQHPVYQWLTTKELNGWNDKQPSWNFAKYLVDENGVLQYYFEPHTSPLSDEIVNAIKQ